MDKAINGNQVHQNLAYRLKDDNDWLLNENVGKLNKDGKRTICIKYTETMRGFKSMVKWKLILSYQKGASLKDMIEQIDGYNHMLIVDTHNKKASHYITIYFSNNLTSQDVNCVTAPLRFSKDDNGKFLLVTEKEQPEHSDSNKFNFHITKEILDQFISKVDKVTEEELEEKGYDNESTNNDKKASSSKQKLSSSKLTKRLETNDFPLIIGVDDIISAKSFKGTPKANFADAWKSKTKKPK